MKKQRRLHNQAGFTLLELLIATTVFSVILLLCTYGMVQIGGTFYKGSTLVRTQNANRKAMDTISQALQYGGNDVRTNVGGGTGVIVDAATGSGVFCTGNLRFRFVKNEPVRSGQIALVVDNEGAACGTGNASTNDDKELLGDNMRITRLEIVESSGSYRIHLAIGYGDKSVSEDVIDPATGLCRANTSSPFCATSEFNTTVIRRV
jgi:prepilin-type N-terminal cleavage/methylation domain-containing protein